MTPQIFMFILGVLTAYLIGSFPTSYIAAKIFKGIDIRDVGSKNVGATNVLRTVGKIPALLALMVDILKGFIVTFFLARFFYLPPLSESIDYDFFRGLLGLTATCGHVWPVFLRFKGGKGVATTIGVFIAIAPAALSMSLGLWLIVFLFTNYVSAASIFLALSLPVFTVLLNKSFWTVFFTAMIGALTIFKHKENIRRLLRHEENKTKIFKKTS